MHMLLVVDTLMHAHFPLWLRPPGVKTKKLQECTQITACRQEEKCRRAGGVIKQESTSAEIGRLLFFCFCPHPLSNNGLSVSLHHLYYFLPSPHLLGKPHYQTSTITDWIKKKAFIFVCEENFLPFPITKKRVIYLTSLYLISSKVAGNHEKNVFLCWSHPVMFSSQNHIKVNDITHWKT